MTLTLFAVFAAVLVVSSLSVILQKNPVASALFLVLSFCSLAGIYLVLQAEFIGMVQIIVYAGAIMVLFLFVIMYLNLGRDVETGMQILVRRGIGWAIGAVLLAEGAIVIGRHAAAGPASSPAPGIGNAQALGVLLYSRYLFPFEITSIVLLVAMVGAVVIARGRAGPAARRGSARAAAPARGPEAVAPPASTPPGAAAPGPDGPGRTGTGAR
jgi:NADH-quinone oxidoreductase subunit J